MAKKIFPDFLMYLNHHKPEYMQMQTLIELCRMKTSIPHRIMVNISANKANIIFALVLIPLAILVSEIYGKYSKEFTSSGQVDIFYEISMKKFNSMRLLIFTYFAFLLAKLSIFPDRRSTKTLNPLYSCHIIFFCISVLFIAYYISIYLQELQLLPIKSKYRQEQFRKAFYLKLIADRANYIVESTQSTLKCCGMVSYKDYLDEKLFKQPSEKHDVNPEMEENREKKEEDGAKGDEKEKKDDEEEDDDLNEEMAYKQKFPISCFISTVHYKKYMISMERDLEDFGYTDVFFVILGGLATVL